MYAVTVLIFFVTLCNAAKLPSDIAKCKSSDAKCLSHALEQALKTLAPGDKSLGAIPLDPLNIEKIHIDGNGGSVDLVQDYNNLKLVGISKGLASDVKIDIDGSNCKVHYKIIFPHLEMIGDYKFAGKLLVFSINGFGPVNITFSNFNFVTDFTCKKFEKNGKLFLKPLDYTLDLIPEKIFYNLPNLVNNNAELSAEVLRVVNENYLEIFMEVKKDYEATFSVIFKSIVTQIFSKVAIDDAFL